MRRFFAIITLCMALTIGATSCKKGDDRPLATEKGTLKIERFEGLENGRGLSGELLLSVSNGLRSNVALTAAEISINYGGTKCCALVLNGEVEVPKRVISSVRVPVSLSLTSPIVSYGVWTKFLRGELDKISITIDAEAKVGAVKKHIYRENIPLREVLNMIGVSTDMIKSLVK